LNSKQLIKHENTETLNYGQKIHCVYSPYGVCQTEQKMRYYFDTKLLGKNIVDCSFRITHYALFGRSLGW
jgi:hypothetical protein